MTALPRDDSSGITEMRRLQEKAHASFASPDGSIDMPGTGGPTGCCRTDAGRADTPRAHPARRAVLELARRDAAALRRRHSADSAICGVAPGLVAGRGGGATKGADRLYRCLEGDRYDRLDHSAP